MDWKKNMKEKFSDIMLNYNLRYHIISNNSIALIGRGFALMLMVHFRSEERRVGKECGS